MEHDSMMGTRSRSERQVPASRSQDPRTTRRFILVFVKITRNQQVLIVLCVLFDSFCSNKNLNKPLEEIGTDVLDVMLPLCTYKSCS